VLPAALCGFFALLFAVLVVRDLTLVSKQAQLLSAIGERQPASVPSNVTFTSEQRDAMLHRFANLIQVPTFNITTATQTFNKTDFARFQKLLQEQYPLMHSKLEREVFQTYTPVYKWKGSAPNADKTAILFLNHYDVVPPGDLSLWSFPPFRYRFLL